MHGFSDEDIAEWAHKYPEFSRAIKKIEDAQENQLIDDGMYGGKEVNAAMAIFLLKANHGKIETSRTELTGKDGNTLNITINAGTGFIPKSKVINGSENIEDENSLEQGKEMSTNK